jgi:hypothetical protein
MNSDLDDEPRVAALVYLEEPDSDNERGMLNLFFRRGLFWVDPFPPIINHPVSGVPIVDSWKVATDLEAADWDIDALEGHIGDADLDVSDADLVFNSLCTSLKNKNEEDGGQQTSRSRYFAM